jgi:hypothetical protein
MPRWECGYARKGYRKAPPRFAADAPAEREGVLQDSRLVQLKFILTEYQFVIKTRNEFL